MHLWAAPPVVRQKQMIYGCIMTQTADVVSVHYRGEKKCTLQKEVLQTVWRYDKKNENFLRRAASKDLANHKGIWHTRAEMLPWGVSLNGCLPVMWEMPLWLFDTPKPLMSF